MAMSVLWLSIFHKRKLLTEYECTHAREKLFQCKICGNGFFLKGVLNRHEKSLTCKLCKKGFSLKGHLTGHERTHIGEKIFQCKICEKRFSVEGYLTGHERTHTGDKTYQCKFCKKGFSQKGNHTHTGENCLSSQKLNWAWAYTYWIEDIPV